MTEWIVTIPTVRRGTSGTDPTHGSQTWIVQTDGQEQARRLALAAAATDDAVRHRRGAVLDTANIDIGVRADNLLGQ
ncbi:hypothetical protein ACQUSR_28770 [Streptomyces sp. P1-3]|uniref:hypothetical protein n=1 Tax=Streptomyces sp. P1-3 TaxID=3421658 RepID=UPI003D367E07